MEPLLRQLTQDYPDITFRPSERFMFTPPATVCFPSDTSANSANSNSLLLLHELSHCLLHHQDYVSELNLLQMEAMAWEKARTLASKYQVTWDEDVKDDYLDSYRDLLHRRSICPRCHINGFFSATDHAYRCPNCQKIWQ